MARESLQIILIPTLNIRSIQIHKPDLGNTVHTSPFHAMYLNGSYGKGRSAGNKNEPLAKPKFSRDSVGLLELPKGGWCCILCSTINEAGRPLHLCRSCCILPTRLAKLCMTSYTSSKFLVLSQDRESDIEDTDNDSDNNTEDGAFSIVDERRIAKERELSEFGRKWTSKDTRGANERSYVLLRQLDPMMSATDRTSMWWTFIAFPISEAVSAALVSKRFQLQKLNSLKTILSKTVVAVQKNYDQLVCAFRLERNPHAVMGLNAVTTFAQSFQAKIQWLDNGSDHFYNCKHPDRPVVCNTDTVPGITDEELLMACGFPQKYRGMSLLEQLRTCLHDGLMLHANEYVRLCISDHRGTASFHAGLTVQEGDQWTRKNGCGIAFPGLMKNCRDTTASFRQWLLQQEIIIAHAFPATFLSGSDRDQQGVPTKFRVEILQEWYDYL